MTHENSGTTGAKNGGKTRVKTCPILAGCHQARQYCEYIQRPWGDCHLPELEPTQTQGKGMADQFDGPGRN